MLKFSLFLPYAFLHMRMNEKEKRTHVINYLIIVFEMIQYFYYRVLEKDVNYYDIILSSSLTMKKYFMV